MFENLFKPIEEDEELDECLKTSITQHFQSLETVFKRYFSSLKEKEAAFVRNQFSTALDVNDILDKLQDRGHMTDISSFALINEFFSRGATERNTR